MKYYLSLSFCLFFSIISYSQDYSLIDEKVKQYPKDYLKIDDLIKDFKKDFSSKIELTRAVFYWVSNNIEYDVDLFKKMSDSDIYVFKYKTEEERISKEKKFNEDLALSTFKFKKAVCNGYAAIVGYLLNKLEIESNIIRGDLKGDLGQIGLKPITNHAWNIVKINGVWNNIDCTLSAGIISNKTGKFEYLFNDKYFLMDSSLFYLNHYPENNKEEIAPFSKSEYQKFPLYFDLYFKKDFEIKSNKTGLISLSLDKKIQFFIDNFDFETTYFEYMFSDEKESHYLETNTKNFSTEVQIENKSENTFLIILINREPLMAYKIIK